MLYEISGSENEIPIILVPGGLSGWNSWKPHAEILSKNFKVIRVQLLTMEAAEKKQSLSKDYSLRSESKALKEIIDHLGLEKINLVGWSHGGAVSLDFALENHNQLQTLTLIEPAAYWVARQSGKFSEEEKKIQAMFENFHDPPTEDDLIAFLSLNGLVPNGINPKSMPQWEIWNALKNVLLSLHTVLEHTDNIARLHTLSEVPVLLVKGIDSTGANAGIVEILSQYIGQNTKMIILPDGHACHIVAKDVFLEELNKFICDAVQTIQ